MKKRLFEKDRQLAEKLMADNHSGEEAIPVIELDFGFWDNLDQSAKEAVIGYTALFCGNVFKAFILDAIHNRQKLNLRLGQKAIDECLDLFEKRMRKSGKVIFGDNRAGN